LSEKTECVVLILQLYFFVIDCLKPRYTKSEAGQIN